MTNPPDSNSPGTQGSQGSGPPTSGRAAKGFSRAEEIFFEVASLSPSDQTAAIARLSGDDAALRRSVMSLLESAARLGGFMEQPVLGKLFDDLNRESQSTPESDDLVGSTLGPFRLEKRIASGGMGTVYLAVRSDAQFDQRVAIKVVKRGMDSEEIVRRFREERQTLAQLDHQYIARLLDGGVTPDGRPYLVMEYVDGLPIDQFCDQQRLSTSDRLKLLRRVCEGVHAAHQSLVIHRDLKPSNILVTPAGIPKLLDFGIAKVLSGTRDITHTIDTERRLTPEYASPEQISGGPITTASDVYSLGVILYELVAGVRPYSFSIRNTDEVRRVVCDQMPLAPSEAVPTKAARLRHGTTGKPASGPVGPAVSGSAANPTSNPTTGAHTVDHSKTRGVSPTRLRGQLRGDVDNIVLMALRKEPQRRYASAEQMGADIGRCLSGMPVEARRDTWLYRSGKFVRRNLPAVIASGLAVAALAAMLVIRTQQKAEIERQRDQVLAANARLDQTRDFLVSILSGAQATGKGPSATLDEVLQDAARRIETAPPGDSLTLASIKEAVGTAMMTLGLTEQARPLLEAAFDQFKSQPALSDVRIGIESELAQLLYYEDKAAQAEAPLKDLLTRERALHPGTHTMREGELLNSLGAVMRVTARLDEALTFQEEALSVRTAIEGLSSLSVAESHNNIASTHLQAGRYREAIESFNKSIEIRIAKLRPGHPMILATSMSLGLALLRDGQTDKAMGWLSLAESGWERAFGPVHPGIVSVRTALGQALLASGRPEQAFAIYSAALQWQEQNASVSGAAKFATRVNMAIAQSVYAPCDEAMAAIKAVQAEGGMSSLWPRQRRQLLQAAVAVCERCGLSDEKLKAVDALNAFDESQKPANSANSAGSAATPAR